MNYRKIDIYLLNRSTRTWSYHCSTTWARTCKEAKARFTAAYDFISEDQVKTRFA